MKNVGVRDAIQAYIVAAAWHYGVEPNQIDKPSAYSVQELKTHVTNHAFRIPNPEVQNNERGHSLPALATCTYNDDTDLWMVKLVDGKFVKVRVAGDEMIVVEKGMGQ